MKKKITVILTSIVIFSAIFGLKIHFYNKEQPPMEIKVEEGIPYGKSTTDLDWVKLGNPILPPEEWVTDDLAGRNTATTLIGTPEIFAKMVNEYDGWIVVTYGHGMAIADTYVYKTSDRGEHWQECTVPPLSWHVSDVGFIDENRLLIGSKLFNEAPIVFTADGGDNWTEISLPEPNAELKSVNISENLISMILSNGKDSWVMSSRDLGNTWETTRSTQQ